jgi:hypothetical protein
MDKTALVNLDIDRGREIVEILAHDGAVEVALWAILAEYEEWRLILSTRKFDSLRDVGEAYGQVIKTLNAAGFGPEKRLPMLILPLSDPFIKVLRRLFGKTKSIEGMRLGGQMLGNRFIEDGYVYRIS